MDTECFSMNINGLFAVFCVAARASKSVCGGGLVVASETPPAVTSMVEISSFPRGSADVGHGDWAALAHSTVIHLTSLRTLL